MTIDIDALKQDKRPQSSTIVHALIDRLEAAEKERDEVAQQLVQSEIGKREISEAHSAVTRRLSVLADENTALRAQPAPSVPDGWKLVPIEPTEKMVNEGSCASALPGPRYITEECAKQCWEYMIKAAPEAKP